MAGSQTHPLLADAQRAVADRTAQLHANASGRVGDAADLLTADADVHFDTIVSVMTMARAANLHDFLKRLVTHLAPDGRLLFVEPTLPYGAQPHRSPEIDGLYLGRDVVAAVRRSGLFVTDAHRIAPPTVPAQLGSIVDGIARFPTPPGDASHETASVGQ